MVCVIRQQVIAGTVVLHYPMKKTLIAVLAIFFTSTSFCQSNKIMDLYHEGNSLYRSGKYLEAIQKYTSFIEATDEPLVIKSGHINRGLSYDRIQEYDKAIEDFTIAISLDSTDMASFIDRGLANMHAKNFETAKVDFNYVIQMNTDKRMKENALYWLAQIDYKSGNMQGAINNCSQLLESNPGDTEVIFLRASAYSMSRDFAKSVDDYSQLIKLMPESYQAYANRGIAKINMLTGNGVLQPTLKQTKSACKDLKKAKSMGDSTVEDMIFIYCEKKKE